MWRRKYGYGLFRSKFQRCHQSDAKPQSLKFLLPLLSFFSIFFFKLLCVRLWMASFWRGGRGGPPPAEASLLFFPHKKRWKIWKEKKNAFSTTQKFHFGIIVSRILEEDCCRLIPHKWFLINISGSEIMKNIFFCFISIPGAPWNCLFLGATATQHLPNKNKKMEE